MHRVIPWVWGWREKHEEYLLRGCDHVGRGSSEANAGVHIKVVPLLIRY
jgi:hypothetical protein